MQPDDATNDPKASRRNRQGKWKRALQVCTNCRSAKLRCDFQERFPEPCTRCATTDSLRSRPCNIDPVASSSRSSRPPTWTGDRSATEEAAPSLDMLASAALLPPRRWDISSPGTFWIPPESLTRPVAEELRRQEQQEAQWQMESPASEVLLEDFLQDANISKAEIDNCFDEFFTFYRPFVPIIATRLDPETALLKCELLFWTISLVGARPRQDRTIPHERLLDIYITLKDIVRKLLSNLMVSPAPSFRVVQALNIICEYPFYEKEGREYMNWFYSGYAVQLGIQLGLHRPRYYSDFDKLGRVGILDADELNERTLSWVYTFIVHQGVATRLGLPSCITDDWVTTSASYPSAHPHDPLLALEPDVVKILRIQRFALRLASVLGNSALSHTGQQDPGVAPGLVALLAAELVDLENALAPMSPTVSAHLLQARLQLYMFELQDETLQGGPDLMICYASSIRMIGILAEMDKAAETRAVFWPRSTNVSYLCATFCLMRLAVIDCYAPRKIHLDHNVVLQEVSTVYQLVKSSSLYPDDASSRLARWIEVLAAELGENRVALAASPVVRVRSRGSIAGLLQDSLVRIKVYIEQSKREAAPPPVVDGARYAAADAAAEAGVRAQVAAAQAAEQPSTAAGAALEAAGNINIFEGMDWQPNVVENYDELWNMFSFESFGSLDGMMFTEGVLADTINQPLQ